jgi:hypothetical protein
MAETLGEIGAAIPFFALRRVGLIRALLQEQHVPGGHQRADVQREDEIVARRRRLDRLACHQIGIERLVVVVGDQGEMIIGKSRIEMRAVAIGAFAHGALEGLDAPVADAGLLIRRDVGRIDRAERRGHRETAGEGLAAGRSVAGDAVADGGELRPVFHGFGIEAAGIGPRDAWDLRLPGQRDETGASKDEENCQDQQNPEKTHGDPPRD